MALRYVASILLVVALGCAAGQYRVEREELSCEDGNAMAHRTFGNLGYEITRFEPATPGSAGMIEGQRLVEEGRRRHGRVRIECGQPLAFQPVEGGWFLPTFDFSRDVYYALLAAPAPREALAAPIGSGKIAPSASIRTRTGTGRMQVRMRSLDRFEVDKTTGLDLHRRAVLVVHVSILNDTGRAYVLDASRIVLVDTQGERVGSLRGGAIATQLDREAITTDEPSTEPLPALGAGAAGTLDGKVLGSGRIAPGETRSGLLYFPAGKYESGRVRLEDEETGEIEGTLVDF
jgi:hypothetical protein